MAKLKDDQIRWVLDLDAKGVQGAINQVSSVIDELKRKNGELASDLKQAEKNVGEFSKELKRLESVGVTSGKTYDQLKKNLAAARGEVEHFQTVIAGNNKTIDQNKTKFDLLNKQLKVNDMTMKQLRERAVQLRAQLNSTVPNTEAWKAINSEFREVTKRMGEVERANKNLCDRINITAGVLKAKMWEFFIKKASEALKKIVDFTKEAVKMAASVQGIHQAFNRFASSDDLQRLRDATGGLVNDMELMKAAVRAENFKIPLKQLEQLLAFAQKRASDTGESVDQLVESLVNGVGRKSPVILKNLGIDFERVNAEIKKGGDFASAVSRIIEEEMTKAGKSVTTAADIATQKTVALQNLQLKWGERFVKLKEGWDKFATSFIKGLTQMIEPQKTAISQYDDQIKKVADLEVNTVQLALRYEELKSKAKLSKDEHIELNKIMNTLRDTVPGVVTQFDAYGNALELNTKKVYEFVEAQKAILEYQNRDALKEKRKELEKYRLEYEKLNSQVEALNRGETLTKPVTSTISASSGAVGFSMVNLTEDEITEIRKRHAELEKTIADSNSVINYLSGKSIEEQINDQKKLIEKRKEFNAMTKAQLEEYIKINQDAADKYIEIAQQVYKTNFGDGDPEEDPRKALEAHKKAVEQRVQNEKNAHEQSLTNLKQALLEEKITREEYSRQAEQLELESLNRILQIRGQEKEQIIRLEAQIADARIKQNENARKRSEQNDRETLEALKKAKEEQLIEIEKDRINQLEKLQEKEQDQKIYALRAAEIEVNTAAMRIATIQGFNENVRNADFDLAESRLNALTESAKEINAAEANSLKEREKLQKLFTRSAADFDRLYNIRTLTQRMEEEKSIIQRYREEGLLSEESYRIALKAIEDKYADEKRNARHEAMLSTIREAYDAEIEAMERLHRQGLISEKEHQQALFRIRMKYAAKYADDALEYITKTSTAVNEMMAAEIANLDARYEAEKTAAAGNAKEIERLEREKAQKKLNIEKKYADVQFAITAAQIVAQTAMAIMQAFAQLGPIAGAIAGALVGVAGAAQLISANAQRKKVKAMTLESAGSAEATPTGKITMREGFAEGGHNADMSGGGYTAPGPKYQTAGWLPVHSGEYVVASNEMARPDVIEKVRAIEQIRRRRIASTSPSTVAGFAEGGGNPTEEAATLRYDKKTDKKLITLLQRLVDGNITVNYGVTELEAAQRIRQQSEAPFTRKT